MSDWEDEPTEACGRGFGGIPAEGQKEISGWSDDEGIDEQIGKGRTQGRGGGDKGGYRRGGGGNSGGYNRRRDDDNAMEIPPIPFSFNTDVLEDFINRLDLGKQIASLADARELREYFFIAFRDLVSSEYVRLEALDPEGRIRKGQQIREAAALMDSFISDVNTLLGESEVMEEEDNVIVQLKQMGIYWKENGQNGLDIVVPQTTTETASTGSTIKVVPQTTTETASTGRKIRIVPQTSTETASTGSTIRVVRQTTSQTSETIRDPQHRKWKRDEQVALPAPHDVKPIIDIYKKARRLYNEEESGFEATILQEDYEEVAISESPQSYGTSRFRQSVSPSLLNLHQMRPVKFGNASDLVDTPWPILPSDWLCFPISQQIVRNFNEVPQKEKRAPENLSSIQTSSHMDLVVRHHRSQIGNLDTPDGAYFSRYDAIQYEENASLGTGGGITVGVATEHTSSTPLRRHDLGLSLTNLNFSMIHGRRSVSIQAPPEPPMPFESMGASGTSMLTVDNEETAIIGPAATSTEVRPIRLGVGGGTPGSTPQLNFRPLLPAINEEQQHLYQPFQDEQLMAAIPRVLQMTMSPPSHVVEEASVPVPASNTQNRDWASIFRPREQIINYLEESATPLRNAARRRRRRPDHHRARVPDAVDNNLETQETQTQERNPGKVEMEVEQEQEQVVATTSSQEMTTSLMANLLQRTAPAPAPEKVEVEQVVATTSSQEMTTSLIPNLLQLTAPAPAPEKLQESLADAQGIIDIPILEKSTDINTTIDILNSPKINIEQPCISTLELTEIDNQPEAAQEDPSISTFLASLGVSAVITDVQILRGPTTTNLLKDVVERTAVAAEHLSLEDNSQYNGKSLEDLSYIVQHSDQLRLMIDHQMELSFEQQQQQQQRSLNSEQHDESSSDSYSSMPAIKVYDPQIIINMPESKIRLIHGLVGALIAQPQVDLQNASFVRNRMDAAMAFRILLDLKAANIITLSPDGRFSSLK